jgi:methyl-accepting chemotaxis protein
MITGIQFQDKTKQRLDHVVDTLVVIDQAIEEIKRGTATAAPELIGAAALDTEWVKNLLARFTMSEVRERFFAQILDGKPVGWAEDMAGAGAEAPSESGSTELF